MLELSNKISFIHDFLLNNNNNKQSTMGVVWRVGSKQKKKRESNLFYDCTEFIYSKFHFHLLTFITSYYYLLYCNLLAFFKEKKIMYKWHECRVRGGSLLFVESEIASPIASQKIKFAFVVFNHKHCLFRAQSPRNNILYYYNAIYLIARNY